MTARMTDAICFPSAQHLSDISFSMVNYRGIVFSLSVVSIILASHGTRSIYIVLYKFCTSNTHDVTKRVKRDWEFPEPWRWCSRKKHPSTSHDGFPDTSKTHTGWPTWMCTVAHCILLQKCYKEGSDGVFLEWIGGIFMEWSGEFKHLRFCEIKQTPDGSFIEWKH